MKNKFYALTLVTTFICMTNSAHAYKYVIFTDEPTTASADQVANVMKTTYPFSKLNIEVEVVKIEPAELECASTNGIDRLVTCQNSRSIERRAARMGGDQAMIVKNMQKWGGSGAVGGGVPVITSGTAPTAMLHEYMHTLGLCDEYEYSASEARTYCNRSKRPNMVLIQPEPSYAGDPAARNEHDRDITWYSDIIPTTPITNAGGSALGTGSVDYTRRAAFNTTGEAEVLGEPIGLYRGKVCNNAGKTSWHPGGTSTIMESTNSGLGAPLEKIVERIMVSKGARPKMDSLVEPEIERSPSEEPAGTVVVTPQPRPEINNSGRGIFKSFFGWIKDLFDGVGKAISR